MLTPHIFRDAEEPHLVLSISPELQAQAPLGQVAVVRMRAGRAWTSAFQDSLLLLVTFLRIEAVHVSFFPKFVAAIIQQ